MSISYALKRPRSFTAIATSPKAAKHEVSREVREAIDVLKNAWSPLATGKAEAAQKASEPYLALVSDSDLLLHYLYLCLRDAYPLVIVQSLDGLCQRTDLDACMLVVTDLCSAERTRFRIQQTMEPGGDLANKPLLLLSQASRWPAINTPDTFHPDQVLLLPTTRSMIKEAIESLLVKSKS